MFKKKLTAVLTAATLVFSALTVPLYAMSFGVGVVGGGAFLETDGTYTLKGSGKEQSKATEDGAGAVAGGYVQVMFGESGFVVGASHYPGEVQLGARVTGKHDIQATNVKTAVTQDVQAELDNFITYYIETPAFHGIYGTVGYSTADLTTNETLGTGATYGNADISGYKYGIGLRGTSAAGIHLKAELSRTDFDTVTITSSSDTTQTDTPKTSEVSADSTGYQFNISLGCQPP